MQASSTLLSVQHMSNEVHVVPSLSAVRAETYCALWILGHTIPAGYSLSYGSVCYETTHHSTRQDLLVLYLAHHAPKRSADTFLLTFVIILVTAVDVVADAFHVLLCLCLQLAAAPACSPPIRSQPAFLYTVQVLYV